MALDCIATGGASLSDLPAHAGRVGVPFHWSDPSQGLFIPWFGGQRRNPCSRDAADQSQGRIGFPLRAEGYPLPGPGLSVLAVRLGIPHPDSFDAQTTVLVALAFWVPLVGDCLTQRRYEDSPAVLAVCNRDHGDRAVCRVAYCCSPSLCLRVSPASW